MGLATPSRCHQGQSPHRHRPHHRHDVDGGGGPRHHPRPSRLVIARVPRDRYRQRREGEDSSTINLAATCY